MNAKPKPVVMAWWQEEEEHGGKACLKSLATEDAPETMDFAGSTRDGRSRARLLGTTVRGQAFPCLSLPCPASDSLEQSLPRLHILQTVYSLTAELTEYYPVEGSVVNIFVASGYSSICATTEEGLRFLPWPGLDRHTAVLCCAELREFSASRDRAKTRENLSQRQLAPQNPSQEKALSLENT